MRICQKMYISGTVGNDDSEEGTQDTLTIPIIVNEEMGYGIYSYERQTPYEEAQSTLNTYQASYDAAEWRT